MQKTLASHPLHAACQGYIVSSGIGILFGGIPMRREMHRRMESPTNVTFHSDDASKTHFFLTGSYTAPCCFQHSIIAAFNPPVPLRVCFVLALAGTVMIETTSSMTPTDKKSCFIFSQSFRSKLHRKAFFRVDQNQFAIKDCWRPRRGRTAPQPLHRGRLEKVQIPLASFGSAK